MALKKTIIQRDGIPTEYHRILFLQSTINSHISIAVLSYLNEDARHSEMDLIQTYKVSITYETDYIENMTIEDAYNYLKTLPEFEGAEDVYEEETTDVEDIQEEELTENMTED